ncbi:MAG TPA: ABC transporter permease subunit, partial [Clostridia bacterium]|nr:ABC transporter permease subunit [Clostridia bacterium]
MLIAPALVYLIIFNYAPMYGVQIAFRDYQAVRGITGSAWAGLKYFRQFFNSYYSTTVIVNTVRISVMQMTIGFPFPILFALMLNELKRVRLKRFIQTVTYAPHFISTVVMAGILISFLSPSSGMINMALKRLGGTPVAFMEKSAYFPWIYVISGIWQNLGWNSILYFAVLSGVDPELYEAARIDGASRLQKVRYIDFPSLLPMIVTLTILNFGNIMSVGFEKAFLLQNNLNAETSELISTYVYKRGLQSAQYSLATAVGLFNSAVNLVLLVG